MSSLARFVKHRKLSITKDGKKKEENMDLVITILGQDKDTKEPVWIEPWSDESYSWWQISRVPAFYKDRLKDLNMKKYE